MDVLLVPNLLSDFSVSKNFQEFFGSNFVLNGYQTRILVQKPVILELEEVSNDSLSCRLCHSNLHLCYKSSFIKNYFYFIVNLIPRML